VNLTTIHPVGPKPKPGTPAAPKKMPRLGWLEYVVVAQTLLPAMMFIPAFAPFRFLTRVASFALPVIAWGFFLLAGRKVAGGRLYAPTPFLLFIMGWLTLSIVHPTVNTLTSAMCAVGITVGVFCPAFWAPAAITDGRQIRRLIVLLLLCNGASALMGIAQVYRPETFRPPKLAESVISMEAQLTIKTDSGREFLRPAGLTDTPGGAALGGVVSCGFGLAVALATGTWWKRLGALGLALAGITILFYSQVRSLTITLILGIAFWGTLLILRGEYRKFSTLMSCVFVLGLVSIAWVVRDGGSAVMGRFLDLFEDRATTVYYNSRGAFIEYAFAEYLPRYPLGAGPGRVGMASLIFGNSLVPANRVPLYAETQIELWILDGGLPVLIAYPLALIVALFSAVRTAVKCPNPDVAYWAGAALVFAVTTLVSALAGCPFMAPMGVQFWALLGAVYGAQEFARVETVKARLRASAP
jgi:hypothetical protein